MEGWNVTWDSKKVLMVNLVVQTKANDLQSGVALVEKGGDSGD